MEVEKAVKCIILSDNKRLIQFRWDSGDAWKHQQNETTVCLKKCALVSVLWTWYEEARVLYCPVGLGQTLFFRDHEGDSLYCMWCQTINTHIFTHLFMKILKYTMMHNSEHLHFTALLRLVQCPLRMCLFGTGRMLGLWYCCLQLSREPLIQTTSHWTLHFLGSSVIHPPSVESIR